MKDRDINDLRYRDLFVGNSMAGLGLFLAHWLYYEFFNFAFGYENYHSILFFIISGLCLIGGIAVFPLIFYYYNKLLQKTKKESISGTFYFILFIILSIPLVPFYAIEIFWPILLGIIVIIFIFATFMELISKLKK